MPKGDCRATVEKLIESTYNNLREAVHDCILHENDPGIRDLLSETANELIGVHGERSEEDPEGFIIMCQESTAKLLKIRDALSSRKKLEAITLVEMAVGIIAYYGGTA